MRLLARSLTSLVQTNKAAQMSMDFSRGSSSFSESSLTLASSFPTADSSARQASRGACEGPGADAACQPYSASAAECLSPVGGAASTATANDARPGKSPCSRRFGADDLDHGSSSSATEQNLFIDIIQAHIRSVRQSLLHEQQNHSQHDPSPSRCPPPGYAPLADHPHRRASAEPGPRSHPLYYEPPATSHGPLSGRKRKQPRQAECKGSFITTWPSQSLSMSPSLAPVWDPGTGSGSGELPVGMQQHLEQPQKQALKEHAWSSHAQTRSQTLDRIQPRSQTLDRIQPRACDAPCSCLYTDAHSLPSSCPLSITTPDPSKPGSAPGPWTGTQPSIAIDDSTSANTDMLTATTNATARMDAALMATRHALWSCRFADWYLRIVNEVYAKGFMTPEQQTALLTRPLADSLFLASIEAAGIGGAAESLAMMMGMTTCLETGHEHKPRYGDDTHPVDDARLERTPAPPFATPLNHNASDAKSTPSLQDFQNHAIPPSIFARPSTSAAPENGAAYHSEHDVGLLEALTLDGKGSLTPLWLDDAPTLQADRPWPTDPLQQQQRPGHPLESSCPRPGIAILSTELAQILQENTDAVLLRTMQICEYSQLCNRRMQEAVQLHQHQQRWRG